MTTKGFTDELKATAAQTVLGVTANELLDSQVDKVAKTVDLPLRLFASATPDALLNIAANMIDNGDGTTKVMPPANDTIVAYAATTLNFQTGSISGGTIKVQGATFAFPSTTIGQFRRMAFVYNSSLNIVDTIFSAAQTSLANAQAVDPGTLFAQVDGLPLGYIDIEATASTAFKTAASATAIIENSVSGSRRIYRISSGGGSGSGGGTDFKAQSITANVMTIKKGSMRLPDGIELYMAADNSFNLKTAVNTLGVTSPAVSTQYYLYLDLAFLPTQTSVGNSNRKVYVVASGTSGMFVVSALTPEQQDLTRYIQLASLLTDGSSNYTQFDSLSQRAQMASATIYSALALEDSDHSIGSVGSAAQLGTFGALSAADFNAVAASLTSIYSLNTDGNESSGNARNLTNTGTNFTGQGFFGRENIATHPVNTGGVLQRTSDTFFNVNLGAAGVFSFGCWAYMSNWAQFGSFQGLMWIGNNTTGSGIFSGNGSTWTVGGGYGSTGGTSVASAGLASGWHHFAVTHNGGTTKSYVDGQLVGTTSGASGNINSSQATFGKDLAGGGFFGGQSQEAFFSQQVLTDAQINGLYSKRFKGQQLAGGHPLSTDSFPFLSLTNKATYWNLDTLNDGSANAKNFTNNNAAVFTGLGLFGAANALKLNGTNQFLSSTDAFYAVGSPLKQFAVGGWFNADNWQQSASAALIHNASTSSNVMFGIKMEGTNDLRFLTSNTGTSSTHLFDYTHNFISGSWHHVAMSYDGVGTMHCYVDGVQIATFAVPSIFNGTNVLTLGARFTTSTDQFFPGRASNCFFIKDYFATDADIQKLMSARIDIPTASATRVQDQDWRANSISEDGQTILELSDSWLVAKTDTRIWANFAGASGLRVNMRMYDSGQGARSVPVRKFDRIYFSNPGTIAHGLPSMPTDVRILHNSQADGKWRDIAIDLGTFADDTNIYANTDGHTVDTTHPVRVIGNIGVPSIGSADATMVAALISANSSAADQNIYRGQLSSQVNVTYLTATTGSPGAGQFRSSIPQRAKMMDITNDLGVRIGGDRNPFIAAVLQPNERGPSDEPVFKPVNDWQDAVRFYGKVQNQTQGPRGPEVTIYQNACVEITFNGTGLYLLAMGQDNGSDLRASIDGGAEGSNLLVSSSAILDSRGYNANRIIVVAAGLTAGLHTVKVRDNSTNEFYLHSYQVLNESTSVRIAPGTSIINGLKKTLLAQDVTPYASGFSNVYGTVGTKGARVRYYQRADGTVGKDIQYVDVAQANLTSADHSNEEPIYYGFQRSFSAGRTDDFHSVAGGAKTFAKSDGSTLLYTNDKNTNNFNGYDILNTGGGSGYTDYHFEGTGLDVLVANNGVAKTWASISIDGGASIGSFSIGAVTTSTIARIVSGLKMGHHTVRLTDGAATAGPGIIMFITYGPKKPVLPTGAMDLGDSFMPGSYVGNTVAGLDTIAQGVSRKHLVLMETLYVGTWSSNIDVGGSVSGQNTLTTTNGSYFEFTFEGTGFELRGEALASLTASLKLRAGTGTLLDLTSTNFPGLTTSNYASGFVFNYSTGAITTTGSVVGSGFAVSGLTYGVYTIRVTNTSSISMRFSTIDVINPFRAFKVAAPYSQQNALLVGSQSVADRRNFGGQLVKRKNVATALGITSSPTYSSATSVPIMDMIAEHYSETGYIEVAYSIDASTVVSGNNPQCLIYVDGLQVGTLKTIQTSAANGKVLFADTFSLPVSIGWHTVVIMNNYNGGTNNTFDANQRSMSVKDI